MPPDFPQFKPIALADREVIREITWRYQPQTSECTFTNLFIWRSRYGFQWSIYRDWLLVICKVDPEGFYALQPIGPPSRRTVTRLLLEWLREELAACTLHQPRTRPGRTRAPAGQTLLLSRSSRRKISDPAGVLTLDLRGFLFLQVYGRFANRPYWIPAPAPDPIRGSRE